MDLRDYVSITTDFPKKGISFKDISPLLADKDAFKQTLSLLAEKARDFKPDIVIGPEARGFVIGAPLALELGVGFVMARKKDKLPGALVECAYDLEYGAEKLYVKEGLIRPGSRVLIVDDLLATGGTATALVSLVKQLQAHPVAVMTVIELTSFQGAEDFKPVPFVSLIQYEK